MPRRKNRSRPQRGLRIPEDEIQNMVSPSENLQEASGLVSEAIPYSKPPRPSMAFGGIMDEVEEVEEEGTPNCFGVGVKAVFGKRKDEGCSSDEKETATTAASKQKEDDSLSHDGSTQTVSSPSISNATPLRLLNRMQKQNIQSELETAKQMSQSAAGCNPPIVISAPAILPSYTPNLASTLLTWHFTMNNVFSRSTSDILLYSSPIFPFPPTRPKCVPLIALSFWDTSSSSGQKELIRLEPGDVEVIKYNEVDAFAPFEPEIEEDQAKKWNMGKMFKKKENVEAEEKIGDGRWSFLCIKGFKESGRGVSCDAAPSVGGEEHDDGDETEHPRGSSSTERLSGEHDDRSEDTGNPWLFLAFPVSAVTRHTESVRHIHKSAPQASTSPNSQSEPSSFSGPLPNKIVSMPDLTAMRNEHPVAKLPSAIRSLSVSNLRGDSAEDGRVSDEPDCEELEASRASAGSPKKMFQSVSPRVLLPIHEEGGITDHAKNKQTLLIPPIPAPDLHSPTALSCLSTKRPSLSFKSSTETSRSADPPPYASPPPYCIPSDTSIALRRTTLHFNKSGSIPLVESHNMDLTVWKPVLAAFAHGKAKMLLWTSDEDRITNADGLLKLGLIPGEEGGGDD